MEIQKETIEALQLNEYSMYKQLIAKRNGLIKEVNKYVRKKTPPSCLYIAYKFYNDLFHEFLGISDTLECLGIESIPIIDKTLENISLKPRDIEEIETIIIEKIRLGGLI